MSVDLLSNLGKEVVSKKDTVVDSKKEVSTKKEGSSLFDSLMKDIQKDKENISTSTSQQKTENKVISENKHEHTAKLKEGTLEASKKVSEGLVDLVVDNVKNKTDKDIELSKSKKTTAKDELSKKNNEEIKSKVEVKVTTIKEAVEDIKNEISNIGQEKKDEVKSKDIKKTIDEKTTAKDGLSKNNEEIKSKVEVKVTTIKEAVEDIKNEISNIGQEKKDEVKSKDIKKTIDEKTTAKDGLSKNNEEIKSKVEVKVTTIKEAVEDIKNEISNIGQEKKDEVKSKDIKKTIDEKTTAKDGLSKNNEEIKSKVEVKVTTIKEAVEDIKNEISKINQLEAQESDTVDENRIDENLKSNNISKNTSNQNQIVQNSQIVKNDTSIDGKTVLLANGFLNSQQKNKETVSLSQVADAKNNIEKNRTLQSVKESANMLGLKIDKIDVEHTDKNGEVKVDIGDKKNKESQLLMMQNRGLNRLIIDKDSNIHNNQNMISGEQMIEAQEEMSSKKEKNVIVNVPQNVVETIQSKIIGAHQKVGSFMSEVARNMYLNYKPPFTSFRMNLNPANLGSIAVVMRASKTDNSVNVSMNMNNSSTMEIFAENKTALQTALQKQLGDGSNVTLNFDMQDSSSNEQFGESNQNNSSGAQYGTSNTSDEPTTAIIEEENTEEQAYM